MSVRCQNQMVTKVTEEEIMGLCNAKPLTTATSKCMVKCQMRQYNWVCEVQNHYNCEKEKFQIYNCRLNYSFQMTDNGFNGFQKANYLDYIKTTSLGSDKAYVEAAEKVVDLCKDMTSPIDAVDR